MMRNYFIKLGLFEEFAHFCVPIQNVIGQISSQINEKHVDLVVVDFRFAWWHCANFWIFVRLGWW